MSGRTDGGQPGVAICDALHAGGEVKHTAEEVDAQRCCVSQGKEVQCGMRDEARQLVACVRTTKDRLRSR